jgi:hypothetical protein
VKPDIVSPKGARAADIFLTCACGSLATVQRNAPVWATVLLVIAAVVLVVIGVVYFAEPAHSLPAFFPGHVSATAKEAGHHHAKHGLAAIVLAILCLGGAWISTGTREASLTTDTSG